MTIPDLEPAALEATAEHLLRLAKVGFGYDIKTADRVILRKAARYLAARSVPEAGKAVDETLTALSGFLVFLKDMRFTGSWDLATLNRAIEVGETIAEQQTALASVPAPSGAPDLAMLARARDWMADNIREADIEGATVLGYLALYLQGSAPQAVPAEEIAGLVGRLKRHYPGEEPMPLMAEAAAALTASEAEATSLRLEEHQDAEDKAAREMATVIQGLRNRATAAERKLEEAREALEDIAASDDIENALDPARNKRVAARALSERERQE